MCPTHQNLSRLGELGIGPTRMVPLLLCVNRLMFSRFLSSWDLERGLCGSFVLVDATAGDCTSVTPWFFARALPFGDWFGHSVRITSLSVRLGGLPPCCFQQAHGSLVWFVIVFVGCFFTSFGFLFFFCFFSFLFFFVVYVRALLVSRYRLCRSA